MQRTIELLKKHNELLVINEPLDIELEIPHIAYIEVKKPDSKALLFNKPISKKMNKSFDIPVLMNAFGSQKRLEILFPNYLNIASEIENLLKFSAPSGFLDMLKKLKNYSKIRHIFPKKTKHGICQEIIIDSPNLFDLPILTTWEKDGGAFITMGQVYTQSLDGRIKNLGMYRLQVYDKNHLGLHWQIHKDSTHFFNEYKQANRKMPVSIGIGGDLLYTWCGQAPLPYGMYELMLYGLIRKQKARVVKCKSNEIYVPSDCDIVIEGFVDTKNLRDEGPFGDHTGFYTPIEPYPVLEISAITMKKNPIYLATVVGKPPLEDKYLGHMTERIFLPLLKTTNPHLIDYYMPENGVFHNLILAKIDPKYPSHAEQIMHGFWSVGQMSFVKHAIFVPPNAPELINHAEITRFILNHLNINDLFFSHGICDALDHSSPFYARGGKLGIDCTKGECNNQDIEILSDKQALAEIKKNYSQARALRQYFIDTNNPLTFLAIDKKSRVLDNIKAFNPKHFRIIFVLDSYNNDLENLYMLLWRIVNNIDASRDILIENNIALIDATAKGALENHNRAWPADVDCTKSVIENLANRGIIRASKEFLREFHIDKSYPTKEIE